jgi:hypothetical protein
MDEVLIDGRTYVLSRLAAQQVGYTQDYIGQLARKGSIDAKRVSGQWYVFLDSLKSYKEKADTFKPEPPKYQPDPNADSTIKIDGKEYVSSAVASKLTEYNQDYVVQLARAGKIPSKQTGMRWYVEREALLKHKHEKESMFRAVQAESVGLKRPDHGKINSHESASKKKDDAPLMQYQKDERPLFPEISEVKSVSIHTDTSGGITMPGPLSSKIPIRVMKPVANAPSMHPRAEVNVERDSTQDTKASVKAIYNKLVLAGALSVLVSVIIGFAQMHKTSIYAIYENFVAGSVQTASAGANANSLAGNIERFLSKELVYERK